jgi:hypothetical protein
MQQERSVFVGKRIGKASLFSAAGLTGSVISKKARETRFVQRASGTIPVTELLECVCNAAVAGTVSYNDLAGRMEAACGVSVSRQAYWERINTDNCVAFFKAILAAIIFQKLDRQGVSFVKNCKQFKRILIQDSTIIQLPARLMAIFSGVRNATAAICNARIQGVYDLCAGQFISFSIDPYSKNDVSVAGQIDAQPGDLILRDRGYFLIETIGEFKSRGIDTISRYKHVTKLFDPETGEEINLLHLLSSKGEVDMMVLAGKEKNIRVRLLATPVTEEVANMRRMKAKKEMNGHAPSQELLRLMSWSIFIVTIENPALTVRHVMKLYGLRWRIESIFKTWKSYFSFDKLHNVSARQLHVLLTARLITISLAYHGAFVPLSNKIFRRANRQLSLMKFMRYVQQNLSLLPQMLNPEQWSPVLLNAIAYYCSYDKRRRQHFIDNQISIFAELRIMQTLA